MLKTYMQISNSAIEFMTRKFNSLARVGSERPVTSGLILNDFLWKTPVKRQAKSILNNRGRVKTAMSDRWTM